MSRTRDPHHALIVLALAAVCSVGAVSFAAADDAADERALIRIADALDNAVDMKDWDRARGYFADEITVAFTPQPGDEQMMAADDLIAVWAKNLHPEKTSFHLRGNHLVTLDGDTATMTSHGYAWNRQEGLEGRDLWEVWGLYVYDFERTADGWQITRFDFSPLHDRGNRAVPTAEQTD